MEYITRGMEPLVLKLSAEYPAILITGPRQVGKTTMLKKLIKEEGKNRNYVSLDDLQVRSLAKSDPAMFFQLYKPPIFIDEVQYAPELFTYIKISIDENQNPGDFWLSGSQLFKLTEQVSESLAGRVALLHLSPLSQREICKVKTTPFTTNFETLIKEEEMLPPLDTPELFQRIWKGGMPALASGKYKDLSIFYSSYLGTYLERDVRELSGAIDALKFLNFLTALSARTGQLINYKSIAENSDITENMAKEWLKILETLGIVFLLHPYSNNVLKRTIKTPKLYFYDTGLVCYLTKWSSPETAMNGAMNGPLLENFAISEIMKSYQNLGQVPYLYYYRDRDSKEIDLLLEKDGRLSPLEIKKTASPDRRLTKVFSVIDKGPLIKGTGGVLCLSPKLGAFDQENLIIPIWLI